MTYDPMTARATTAGQEKVDADRVVRALDVAGPSLNDVVASIERSYGKTLVLQSVGDDELTTVTGLWVETDDTGYVFYRSDDPFVYQIHSIFHEFGHILARHDGCDALGVIDSTAFISAGLGEQIRRARARGALDDPSEILAEEIAFALSRLVICGSASGLHTAFE